MPSVASHRSLRHAVLLVLVVQTAACADEDVRGDMRAFTTPTREISAVQPMRLTPDDMPSKRTSLVFAVTPFLPDAAMRASFEPIAAYVSERLGVPVRFRLARSYKELLELVASDQVDIVQISPLSYVIAKREVPGLRLIGSSLSFGSAVYSSFIVARSDMGSNWLRRLKKQRFAFVDSRSASGFLFPYAALLRLGLDPERDLDVVFSGSHDRSIEMLNRGEVAAIAISSGTLNLTARGEVIGSGNLRILHKAGNIPYDALCTAPHMPESAARKIASAFGSLNTRDPVGRKVLKNARGQTGWVQADDTQYDQVREVSKKIEAVRWRAWQVGKPAATEDHRGRTVPMFGAPTAGAATPTGASDAAGGQ